MKENTNMPEKNEQNANKSQTGAQPMKPNQGAGVGTGTDKSSTSHESHDSSSSEGQQSSQQRSSK